MKNVRMDIYRSELDLLIVRDRCLEGERSVTNSIEDVLALAKSKTDGNMPHSAVYCDSQGEWWGILIDDDGFFQGFFQLQEQPPAELHGNLHDRFLMGQFISGFCLAATNLKPTKYQAVH